VDHVAGLDLLLERLRSALGKSLVPAASRPTSDAVESALALAADNKLLLLVASALDPDLSPAQQEHISRYKLLTMSRNTGILHELIHIRSALSVNHIKFIAMKGPLQQLQLHGNYFLRPSSDIDLLVADRDQLKSIKALSALEYEVKTTSVWWRTFLGEQHLVKRGPPAPSIDLHYRLQQPGSPAPRSTAPYLAKPAISTFLDVELPTLPADAVPLLCAMSIVKALYNRESAGAHVADLYVSLKAGAPQAINSFLTNARAQHIEGTALAALRILAEIFGGNFAAYSSPQPMLSLVTGRELVRLIFCPADSDLVWPKRRAVLWELCQRRPIDFIVEAARASSSELALRLFERS
jgi:hypothetical protein